MFQQDGTLFFYGAQSPLYCLVHSSSYVVRVRKSRTCGLCLLRQQFETEVPLRIHASRHDLADNGNPAMDGRFVGFLETSLGLVPPLPDQSLPQFRHARKQLFPEPNRKHSPVTRALWDMFGKQPKLAAPLLLALLGATEAEICQSRDMSLYNVRMTIGKAINMAAGYLK